MEKIKFRDRISKYPNRKKLKIISKNENEIIAEVTPADEAQVEGVELNAKILNKWQDVISTSEDNAMLAKNKVHIAEDNAKLAVKYSKEAISKAEQAEMVAEFVSNSVNNTFIPIKTSELYNDNQFISAKEQNLSDEEKTQARENIGAGTSNFSGNYEDLINKPYIPNYDNVPTKDYVDEKISDLVNSAPETLDTLGEIASALEENEDVISALNSVVANKVDKVAGKSLSTNDFTDEYKTNLEENSLARHSHTNKSILDSTTASFTTEEKNKLSGIEEGAEVNNPIDSELSLTSENPVQNKIVTETLNSKVDKVNGKQLSTNDYTTEEKNKLAGIQEGAEVNAAIDSILSTTSTNAVQNNVITQALNNKLDKDNAWECILNQPLTTTAVNVVKFLNVLDFNNYDYKIEYETCSEGNFPSTAIRLRFLNNSNNVVTVNTNSWGRYNINTDYSSGGSQEGGINPITGYGFSKESETIIDWGVDSNDGSGAILYSGEFIPVFDIYGNYSIIYKTSHIRSSPWCQQYYIYSGCVNFTYTFNGGVTGFSLTEDNGANFKVGTNYIKIYRRPGGWNKYNGG